MRAKLKVNKKVMDDTLNPPEICFYADSKSIDQEFPNGLVTFSELDRYNGNFEEVKRIEIKSGISQIDCWTLDRLRNLEEIEFVKEDLLTHAMYGFKVLFEKTQDDPKIWKRIAKPFKLSRATEGVAKIIDLTGGKYRDLYDPDDNSRDESFNKYLSQITRFSSCYKPFLTKGNSIKDKLCDMPVYLVESSMSGKEIKDPDTNDSIVVPDSIEVPNIPDDFSIETWKSQKTDGIKKAETSYSKIDDFLGLYVPVSNGGPRIFIWMDRIYNTAKGDIANATLLFHKIFCHEMAHALMDVELCGLKHNDKFTYSDDWVYMIFEEAYANSIALQVLKKSKKRITPFIEDSIRKSGPGYASGWELYKHNSCNLDQWIAIKMLFNNYIANLIEDSWKIYYEHNRFVIAPTCYRYENGKIKVRGENNNWQALQNMKQLLNDFANYLTFVSAGSKQNYISYVNSVDGENKGKTLQWLKDAATNADPLGDLSIKFDKFFNGKPIEPKRKSNLKTGLLTLGKFVFGFNESSINLQSIKNFDLVACQLIAQTAIFCPVHVFEAVVNGKCGSKDNQSSNGNAFGSWFNCKYRRAKNGEQRRQPINGIILDDNTKANQAIKKAVLKGLEKYGIHKTDIKIFKGFEACHIWEKTCYDERYHTSVANLVLIPREIAGFTDHCDAVKELLKYESFKRFGFKPDDENTPNEPKNYDMLTWRTTPTP